MNRRVLGMVHTLTAVCWIVLAARGALGQCCGDCNGDGAVSVDEIITVVNRALTGCSDDGICSAATCPDLADNTTNLLYTFVTNQAGFDTGISISNTGADPFGTSHLCPRETCRCTLTFFGDRAPVSVSSGGIPPGQTYTALASSSAPGFQGYMIASCNFPYAHGFALISDLGTRNLAAAYLAQVICTNRALGGG